MALAIACDGDADKGGPPKEEACTLEAAPAATPVAGDANGDGHLDVSDGVYLQRHLFDAGPAPACEAAVDVPPNGSLDATEAFASWYQLGPQSYRLRDNVDASACALVARAAETACGDGAALGVSAPETVSGAEGAVTSFTATVTLVSPKLAVEAWSFAVQAEGCTLSAATTAGTKGADKADDPPGLRDGGFAWQGLASETEGAVITVLNWRDTDALSPSEDAVDLHAFTVSATPGAACAPCTLSVVSGTEGEGVEAVLSGGGGYRYVPGLGSVSVSVCPG